jgi:hypothetical protein
MMGAMGRIGQAIARWRRSGRRGTDPSDLELALMEAVHERDVSIARAAEAEARERLVRDRLESLVPLEHRVEVAERRALDAERRLDEVIERVGDPQQAGVQDPNPDPDPGDDAARHAAELRARLTRSAERKKPAPRDDS